MEVRDEIWDWLSFHSAWTMGVRKEPKVGSEGTEDELGAVIEVDEAENEHGQPLCPSEPDLLFKDLVNDHPVRL